MQNKNAISNTLVKSNYERKQRKRKRKKKEAVETARSRVLGDGRQQAGRSVAGPRECGEAL